MAHRFGAYIGDDGGHEDGNYDDNDCHDDDGDNDCHDDDGGDYNPWLISCVTPAVACS